MEYRKFGSTDLTVSALGMGCWDAAAATAWSTEYSNRMSATVNRAIDLGITCFDTAPNYGGGESELMLGRTLGPRRKDVVVVTKCGFGFPERPRYRDSRREAILPLVDQSLERLQTDYIDVLLIHFPDTNAPFDETMGALDSVVQQGKVRYVGVGNFTLAQLEECQAVRRIDVVQYQNNLFDRRMEQEIFPYCRQQGIGVMAWGPLASGLLGGVFTADTKFGDKDWRSIGDTVPEVIVQQYADEVFGRNVQLVNELKPIAASLGKTVPQLALNWSLDNPAVSVAIAGILNIGELEEDLGAVGWSIPPEAMRRVDDVFAKHGVDTNFTMFLDP